MTSKKDQKHTKTAGTHSSTHSSGWMLMLFFISGFMFFIGVLAGRNTAPIHFDKDSLELKLAHLQRSVLDKSSIATAAIEKKFQKNLNFDFYDKVKEKTDHKGGSVQTPVKKPRYLKPGPMALAMAVKASTEAGPKSGVGSGMEPVTEPGPEIRHETGGEKKMAKASLGGAETKITAQHAEIVNQLPVTVQPVTTKPAQKQALIAEALKKPVPSGRKYAIQVASLKDTKSAERIRNKFRSKGYPAYVQEAVVQGRGQWFRVRIGPYSDKSLAASDLSRLQQAGVDAIIFLSDTGANSNAGGKNENNKG